jgi:hypothetical protein
MSFLLFYSLYMVFIIDFIHMMVSFQLLDLSLLDLELIFLSKCIVQVS